jgi:dolichol-phosphate mannosyltransferase
VNRHVHTYTALFRAYHRKVINEISFEADGFLAGTELMVKAMFAGFQVEEFPVALYRRTYGVSKAKLMRTIHAHLRFQMRILLHRSGLRPIQSKIAQNGRTKWTWLTRSSKGANQK